MPCTPMWWAFDVHTSTCYIITRFWSTLRPTYHHGKSIRLKNIFYFGELTGEKIENLLVFFSKKKRVGAPQQIWWVKAYRTCAVCAGWMIHAVGHEMVWSLGYGCFSYVLLVSQACRTLQVPCIHDHCKYNQINIDFFNFFSILPITVHPAVASIDQYAVNTRTFSVSHKHIWVYVLLSPPCFFLNHCVVG